jgi:ferredoxin-thioredoxin reductase catalytic subunit
MGNPWDNIVGTKEYEETYQRIAKIAEEKRYAINSDEERVKKVLGLMTGNHGEFGEYYCPCKQSRPLDPNKDIICPCPQLDDEIKKDGNCFCRLFFKKP